MDEELFPTAFFFQVRISGAASGTDTSFKDVSGIAAEMDMENYVEGGETGFVYRLPKGVKYQNLVLSRGLAPTSSPLVDWCRDVLERGVWPIVTRSLEVSLLDAEGNPLRSWSFAGAYPVKWQAENFNSTKNEVAIEKIEFAFQGFTRGQDN